jgi:hypothetical protein
MQAGAIRKQAGFGAEIAEEISGLTRPLRPYVRTADIRAQRRLADTAHEGGRAGSIFEIAFPTTCVEACPPSDQVEQRAFNQTEMCWGARPTPLAAMLDQARADRISLNGPSDSVIDLRPGLTRIDHQCLFDQVTDAIHFVTFTEKIADANPPSTRVL